VISTLCELWSRETPNWGEIHKSGSTKLSTRSHTDVITHQLWVPRQNSGGGRRRKVQFSQLHKVSDLDFTSCQGDISMRSIYRTTSVLDRVTVASSSMEIWPSKIRVISTFRKVWTHVIAFLEGNSKIGLREAVGQVPYYHDRSSLLSSTPKWRRK